MDFGKLATSAITGATTGAALGPIGAGVGALLGAAPGLLGALGVHIFDEGAADSALNVIKAITGKSSPTAGDVSGLTPEQSVALQLGLAKIAADREKAEMDADAADRAADLNEVKTQLADIASAREQTVRLAQAGSKIAWGAPVVSLVVLAVFAVAMWKSFHMAPADINPVQIGIIEILKATAVAVVSYWVGSSAGSQAKDQTIQMQAAKQ